MQGQSYLQAHQHRFSPLCNPDLVEDDDLCHRCTCSGVPSSAGHRSPSWAAPVATSPPGAGRCHASITPTAGVQPSSGPVQGIPGSEEVAPNSAYSPREHLAQLLTTAPVSERLLQHLQSTEPAHRSREAQSQRSRFQRRKLKTPVICAGTLGACSRTSSLLVHSLIINSLSPF